MSFVDAIKVFFANYINFSGRARRSEYWWAVLFIFVVNIFVSIVDNVITPGMVRDYGNGLISILWSLAIIIPSLSLNVRRLHDIDKSGWFVLLGLIPIVGPIVLIVWACQASSAANQWGLPANGITPQQPYGGYPQQNGSSYPQQPSQGYAAPNQQNPYAASPPAFGAPQQAPAPYGTNPLPQQPEPFGNGNAYGTPPTGSDAYGTPPENPNPYTGDGGSPKI